MPPVLTPTGDSFNGIGPNIWIQWPGGQWVFGRIRGNGLAIWHNVAAVGVSALSANIFPCYPGNNAMMAAFSSCQCSDPCPGAPGTGTYPGPHSGITGCCDGTAVAGGNIQSYDITALIPYDLEAFGFNITGTLATAAQVIFASTATIGPLTIDAATFPGPGTLYNDYTDGHNLSDAAGGQLYMMKFTGSDGLPLYVCIASGVQWTTTADIRAPFAPGWTLAMQGVNMHAFVYTGVTSGGGTTTCPSDVVTDICERAGLDASQINVALLQAPGNIHPSDKVEGFVITKPSPAADILKILMQAYFFDACETNGQMLFVPRGLAPKLTIPEADLGLVGDKAKLIEQFDQEQDLPARYVVSYQDPLYLYQQGKQEKIRNSRLISTKQEVILNIPMVMDPDWARQVAEKSLYISWLERQHFEFKLARPYYLLLDPTDAIDFVYEGLTFRTRTLENSIGQGFATELKEINENTDSYLSGLQGGAPPASSITPGGKNEQGTGPTLTYLFDTPLLQDSDSNPGGTGKYAALASPAPNNWPGAALFISSDDASYAQEGQPQTVDPAFGQTTGVLANPADPFVWDDVNTLNIQLTNGTLAGDTDANVLNGSNMLLVGSAAAGFEVVQFGNAVQEMDGSWTISHLLRGRRGTEWAAGFWGDFANGLTTHATGDLVVAVSAPGVPIGSAGVERYPEPLALLNALRYYRGVTLGQDLTTVASQPFTIAGKDLYPYAPVKVGGTEDANQNIILTWQRRTRIGGDGWGEGSNDLPLSEDSEAYQVDIKSADNSMVLRTIAGIAHPTANYTLAQQVQDFGAAVTMLVVDVYQMSGETGRGFKGHGVIDLTLPAPIPPEPPGPCDCGTIYVNNG